MKDKMEKFPGMRIIMLLCLLLGAVAGCGDGKKDPPGDQGASSIAKAVKVSEVRAGSMQGGLEYVGTLCAHMKVTVASQLGGTIEKLLFERGDRVQKGQVLAEIDSTSLRIEVREASGSLAAALSHLHKTENGSRPEEVLIAEAAVVQFGAALREAENHFERIKDLQGRGAVSVSDYDTALKGLEAARAGLESARQQLSLARQGPREEDREAARAGLRQAEAALAMAEERLRKSVILSPCDGIVSFRRVEQGEVVSPGAVITQVVNLEKMKIRLSLGETYLPVLMERKEFPFTVEAFPGRTFSCRLEFISPTADPATRSFPLEFSVVDPAPELADGMTVKVRFPLLAGRRSIKVPSAWLAEEDGRMGLFVVEKGKALFRKVELGSYYEYRVEISSGLAEGDLVITSPAGLRSGDDVKY